MAFILMRTPAYAEFYGQTAPEHGISALTDQQVAGGMMLGLDLIVMLFALGFFFYRSAEDHDRAERAAAVPRMRRRGGAPLVLLALAGCGSSDSD